MLDVTTLYAGGALSALLLSVLIFGACIVLRETSYLLTLACGMLCMALACGSYWYYRSDGGPWLAVVSIASVMGSFLLIHWAMSQYTGRRKLGLFDIITVPAILVCWGLVESGLDGVAFVFGYLVTAMLIFDTTTLYWSHRREVPFLMHGLAFLGATTGTLFLARAYALALAGQWYLGEAPDNWAEDLTGLSAVTFINIFGPIVVALYYVRDRVALISEAVTDPLTGLQNRRALQDAFEQTEFSKDSAVIMFDLDHFKKTNDVFGHQVGDEVLKRFAYVVTQYASEHARGFRLGGEEFAIVCTRGGERAARSLASRVGVAFGAEVVGTPLGPLRSTVSSGVAAGSPQAHKLQDLIGQADTALYEAKRLGRNRVVTFSEMAEALVSRDMRAA